MHGPHACFLCNLLPSRRQSRQARHSAVFLIEELDTLVFGHFSVVDSFWNIPWSCRECFIWSETPCLPILGASLANLAKSPTRRLRNRWRKKRSVGIPFSGILDRIANINLDSGLDCDEKKAYELAWFLEPMG